MYTHTHTDSDSEVDNTGPTTPVCTGPPPPPLRGIPHLNPDAVNISDNYRRYQELSHPQPMMSSPLTTVLPFQTHQTPFRSLVMDGLRESHQPNSHPVPLLTTPYSSFRGQVPIPQATSILHGETPKTSSTIPLANQMHSPQPDSMLAESGNDQRVISGGVPPGQGPSVMAEHPTQVPSSHHKPILVMSGPHPVKSLPSPSPVTTTPINITHTASTVPDKKPSTAPLQHDMLSEGVNDQLGDSREEKPSMAPPPHETLSNGLNDQLKDSKEDLSSESSETLTSDSESVDLREEARDTFDPSK